MYFLTFSSIFVTLIFLVNCGFLQQTPSLQTNNNFGSIGKTFPSIKIKNNTKILALKTSNNNNKWPIKNNFGNQKLPLFIKPILPKNNNKKLKVFNCNANYSREDPFHNKSYHISKILTWEFQLYKLDENNNNNWGQQLNKEERENIILISELICWLTLKEQLNRHLNKALNLLISLKESDRILEKQNFLCSFFNYLKKINEPKELLYHWTLEELKQNFWNILEIKEENEDILFKTSKVLNFLSYGDALINLFEFTVLASPNKIEAKEYVDNLIERINNAKEWTKIIGEFLIKVDNFKGWNNSDIRLEQFKIISELKENCCEEKEKDYFDN